MYKIIEDPLLPLREKILTYLKERNIVFGIVNENIFDIDEHILRTSGGHREKVIMHFDSNVVSKLAAIASNQFDVSQETKDAAALLCFSILEGAGSDPSIAMHEHMYLNSSRRSQNTLERFYRADNLHPNQLGGVVFEGYKSVTFNLRDNQYANRVMEIPFEKLQKPLRIHQRILAHLTAAATIYSKNKKRPVNEVLQEYFDWVLEFDIQHATSFYAVLSMLSSDFQEKKFAFHTGEVHKKDKYYEKLINIAWDFSYIDHIRSKLNIQDEIHLFATQDKALQKLCSCMLVAADKSDKDPIFEIWPSNANNILEIVKRNNEKVSSTDRTSLVESRNDIKYLVNLVERQKNQLDQILYQSQNKLY